MTHKKNNHVSFRKYSQEVLDKSWKWLNDPEIKELTLTPDFDRESQQTWFLSLPDKSNYYIRSVWWNEKPIGAFGIKNITDTDGEVWYYIGVKKYWGKGIGSQMMQYLIEYARSQKLKSVYAKLHKTNTGSYKLCEKFGYKGEREIYNTIIIMRLFL
ncbi:GNAT family N-acetyltransferase [Proteiniphilum sp.]|uniref:GNAT family N-acetyltransferase n=1 Tax=Proteiniphilum sp. TaxID=1926877 RepID=UPI00332E205F